MIIYTNHTRHPAIVTIKIETTDKPNASLEIGQEGYYDNHSGDVGVHDYVVDAGKELRTVSNTSASFLHARTVG